MEQESGLLWTAGISLTVLLSLNFVTLELKRQTAGGNVLSAVITYLLVWHSSPRQYRSVASHVGSSDFFFSLFHPEAKEQAEAWPSARH